MSLPLNSNQLLTSVTEGVNRLDTDESVHVGITVFSRDVNLSVRQSTGFTLRSAGRANKRVSSRRQLGFYPWEMARPGVSAPMAV
jgi:hypothetical protein